MKELLAVALISTALVGCAGSGGGTGLAFFDKGEFTASANKDGCKAESSTVKGGPQLEAEYGPDGTFKCKVNNQARLTDAVQLLNGISGLLTP